MLPERAAVCRTVLGWAPLVDSLVGKTIDRWLVLGVVAQESQGNPWAWRYEPGFWSARKAAIIADVRAAAHDAWLPHGRLTPEDFDAACDRRAALLAASFGLMQVMLATALELGAVLSFPVELCDPTKNIQLGTQLLRKHFDRTAGAEMPVRAALLAYNGGGAAEYPDLVLAWRDDLMVAAR